MEHRKSRKPEELEIVADVTIDPTSSPKSLDFVTLHIPHLFFRMLPTNDNVIEALHTPVVFFEKDKAYRPLVRPYTAQDK